MTATDPKRLLKNIEFHGISSARMRFDEELFRSVESILDGLLGDAEDLLSTNSISVTDLSTRQMHGRAESLEWFFRFEKDRPIEHEIARATVHLLFKPPIPPNENCEIQSHWRSEIFQAGQESRHSVRGRSTIALSELESEGVSAYVMSSIQNGFGSLAENS